MERLSEAFDKVKSYQPVEKMKMLVGMEVYDEESAAVNSAVDDSSFMDEFNRNCTLSTKQRIQGFAICFVAGLTCTFLVSKFQYSIRSGAHTAFLIGPKRQVAMMLDPVRIYATALYLASMIIALFCALYVHNKLLTLLAITLEFGALTWYSLSYIPFARSMVSRVLVSCFDTEF
uniref:Vesicle transport protein n=1 Tax=Chenopodium quinoa TaxID=63459 RepID=A0A803KNK1_CHEQI